VENKIKTEKNVTTEITLHWNVCTFVFTITRTRIHAVVPVSVWMNAA